MEKLMSTVESVNGVVNDFVWGPPILVLFMFVGIMFTVRTRFFQISKIKMWLDETFLSIFKKQSVRKASDEKSISQFQALSTALAATIGTGNIAGVATAIVIGGPGAVFWMWVSAFFGMMTNFGENVLGIKYRYKNEKGEWVGGAMVYMERGVGGKFGKILALFFSVFCILASFGIGNMTQANSIADALNSSFNVPMLATGIFVAIFAALVIVGGIRRIAKVTEKVVPFMALFYMAGGLIIILLNIKGVPATFGQIFSQAFSMQSAAGGASGVIMAQAVRYGIARGVFSNEAGLGSSVMVHSASDVKEPVVQGMWGVFEVFADTLIVCTITALCILTSGISLDGSITGASLTAAAFGNTFGRLGTSFVSIALMLFAFSTLLGWSYYGERGIEYLFGLKAIPVYKVIFIALIVVGCVAELELVWDLSDTFNGLMSIPNLIAVTLLSGQVIEITKDYMKRRSEGKLQM